MRYDRTALQAAARARGHENPRQMSLHLGIGQMTGWRLWHGHGAPSARTAALVEFAYGIRARRLLDEVTAAAEQIEVPA